MKTHSTYANSKMKERIYKHFLVKEMERDKKGDGLSEEEIQQSKQELELLRERLFFMNKAKKLN